MPAHAAMPTATIIRVIAIQDLFLMTPSGSMSRGRVSGERPERLGNVPLRLTGNLYAV
jgi:hypothetical protein